VRRIVPALLTRISMRPKVFTISLTTSFRSATLAAAGDVLRTDPETAQTHQAGLAQIVVGKACDVLDFFTIVGQRHGNVCFAAAWVNR
ncbi:MAG: hypothetical protein P8Z41_06455, partial [Anaerolineales bacterium]